jgi:hypothetical protein
VWRRILSCESKRRDVNGHCTAGILHRASSTGTSAGDDAAPTNNAASNSSAGAASFNGAR